jgi:hypothetical protein
MNGMGSLMSVVEISAALYAGERGAARGRDEGGRGDRVNNVDRCSTLSGGFA